MNNKKNHAQDPAISLRGDFYFWEVQFLRNQLEAAIRPGVEPLNRDFPVQNRDNDAAVRRLLALLTPRISPGNIPALTR